MGSRVLVTGGAGFIGSHTCLVLLEAGYDLLILDNFSNSSPEALTRVAAVANVSSGQPTAADPARGHPRSHHPR